MQKDTAIMSGADRQGAARCRGKQLKRHEMVVGGAVTLRPQRPGKGQCYWSPTRAEFEKEQVRLVASSKSGLSKDYGEVILSWPWQGALNSLALFFFCPLTC